MLGGVDYLITIYQSPPMNNKPNLPDARHLTMLPVSRIIRRAAPHRPHPPSTLATSRRTFVKPSSADRASVVDVPAAYQDESHFAPRAGNCPPS